MSGRRDAHTPPQPRTQSSWMWMLPQQQIRAEKQQQDKQHSAARLGSARVHTHLRADRSAVESRSEWRTDGLTGFWEIGAKTTQEQGALKSTNPPPPPPPPLPPPALRAASARCARFIHPAAPAGRLLLSSPVCLI